MAGYIGTKAVITSGVSASIDELNLIDGVTATTAELNYNDTGAAVGVVVASKTVTADANKDVASFRNITLTGELDAGSLDISGDADIDGTLETDALSIAGVAVTTTAAELNLIDGGTARGTTAIVDADGVLVNDAGTMRMTTMATLATYMGTKISGGMALVQRTTISDDATVNFTGLDESVYSGYIFYFHAVVTATNNVFAGFRVSVDSGSNYLSASDSYHAFARTGTAAGDSTFIPITVMAQGDSNYYPGLNAQVLMTEPYENTRTVLSTVTNMSSRQDANSYTTTSGGYTKAATQVNAIQVLATSGNLSTGIISLYGLKK